MKTDKTSEKSSVANPQNGKTPGTSQLDASLQGNLGKRLREAYDEVVNEEVPAKFLDLLNQLKKREGGGGERTS